MKALNILRTKRYKERNNLIDFSTDEYTAAIRELEDIHESIMDECMSDDLGYLLNYPQFGKMKKNTKYKIYAIEVNNDTNANNFFL